LIGGAFTQVNNQITGRIAKIKTISGASSIPVFTYSDTIICQGRSALLQISAGNLNGAENWSWYRDSCGTYPMGSGNQILVSPTQNTTYYARGEGTCSGVGSCNSVNIVVSNENLWTGTVSNEWENPLNWSCNSIPGPLSIVFINAPSPFYPTIRSIATSYQIFIQPGASLLISPGFRLDITGP